MRYTTKLAILICILFNFTRLQAQTIESESGYALMLEKNYKQALKEYQRSFAKGNRYFMDYYNAACCAALLKDKKSAFNYLKASIRNGYLDEPYAIVDKDLVTLREDPKWKEIKKEFILLKRAIEREFLNISSIGDADLIPFYEKGKWGYLNSKNKKIVVMPKFRKLDFMQLCVRCLYSDDCLLTVNKKGLIENIQYPDHSEYVADEKEDNSGPQPISSADGFKGFKLNDENKIVGYSDIYDRSNLNIFNISKPFKINGKYYAITRKEKSGIIDEKGEPLPGFNFVHNELELLPFEKDSVKWFYFADSLDKKGFISEKGKIKLYDEFKNRPFTQFTVLDYTIQKVNGKYGVIDLINKEWFIKPQELKITDIEYTGDTNCTEEVVDRSKVKNLYFLIEDKDKYYIDQKFTKYKPVK